MNCGYCGCLLPDEYHPNCKQCGGPRKAALVGDFTIHYEGIIGAEKGIESYLSSLLPSEGGAWTEQVGEWQIQGDAPLEHPHSRCIDGDDYVWEGEYVEEGMAPGPAGRIWRLRER